jgi:hypothetical protein
MLPPLANTSQRKITDAHRSGGRLRVTAVGFACYSSGVWATNSSSLRLITVEAESEPIEMP